MYLTIIRNGFKFLAGDLILFIRDYALALTDEERLVAVQRAAMPRGRNAPCQLYTWLRLGFSVQSARPGRIGITTTKR